MISQVQIHILKFLALLFWLDGRPLLPLLPPVWIEILNEVFTFQDDGFLRFRRVLTMMGKKNLKSLMAMVLTLYFCMVWKAHGSKGNQIYVLANDKDQASDDLTLLKKLVWCNPVLLAGLTIKGDIVERKDGQGFIQILPAGDAIGMHGKSYLLAIFDEIHGMRNYDVLTAMELDRSRPDAMQVFCTYASLHRHAGVPLVDMLKQHEAGTDPRLYVRNFTGSIEAANPAMDTPLGGTRKAILEAQQSLPSWIFRRLYLNEPGQPDSAAFDFESLDASIVKGRKVLPPQPGVIYFFFVDLSGGGADDATLGITHRDERGRIVLDLVMDQGARTGKTFSPEESVKKFADTIKLYAGSSVTGDGYGGQWGREAFRKHGVQYEVSEQTRSEIYASFEPMLNTGEIEMLDLPILLQQFIGLIRKGIRIDHPPSEHDDYSNAAAGACVLAKAPTKTPGVYVFHGSDERPRMPDEHLFTRIE
ncbi:MAG: terminase large subunit [Nitrospira sp.]|nr:terminase large subunit [Nitrospira sp.]